MYENPLFTAALDSVTSQLLTTSQAAEKFGVRESALTAALSWYDVEKSPGDMPTSDAVTVSTGSSQVIHRYRHHYKHFLQQFHFLSIKFRLTTCLKNLEMSGLKLTKSQGNVSGKWCWGKMFVVGGTSGLDFF